MTFSRLELVVLLAGFLVLCAPLQPQTSSSVPGATAALVQQLRSRNYPAAAALADEAIRAQPNDPRLWTLKGMALSGEAPDHPAAALPAYHRALEIAPTYLPALEAAAQAEYTLGDPGARAHLDRILAQQPGNPTAHAMLAALDFRAGSFALSAGHFRAAQSVVAGQPLPQLQYAISLANSGEIAAAAPVFENVLALDPANEAARYDLALAYLRLHQTQKALDALTPLLATAHPTEEAFTLAAETDESLGNTQQAVDLLRRSILLHPKNPDAYIYLAHLSFAHSSVQVGIDILNAGIRQLPDEPRLYLARGVLRAQLAQNDEASADFDKAAALDPRLTLTRAARGVSQSQQHHDEQALLTFREAARLHPENALTQYLLAEALSNTNPGPETADGKAELQAASAAVKLDPDMADAQNLLATIYLRQGDFTQAANHCRAVLLVHPDDQQALYHLVLAARKGVGKEELPALVKRLAAARDAGPSPSESPKGYLVEAK